MRASTWIAPRTVPGVGLALSLLTLTLTLTLAACGDVTSGSAPPMARDGTLIHAEGTAEFSTQASPQAPRVLRAQAPWRVQGTMRRGIAMPDFNNRALAMQDRTRGEDPDGDQQRALSELGARMIPAVAVDAKSKLAAYGRTSVVEDSVGDGHGRMLHLVAISDLKKGPLTDYLIVRDGQVLNYQKVSWVREGDLWRPVEAKGVFFGKEGSTLRSVARVAGLAAAPETDATSSFAVLTRRVEEIRFGAFAKRLVLPRVALAQSVAGVPGDLDCSQYRRTNVSDSRSSCWSFTMNQVEGLIVPALAAISVLYKGLNMETLVTTLRMGGYGMLGALLEAITAAGISLSAFDWAILTAVGVLIYTSYQLATCIQFHQTAIAWCQRTDPRPAGGGGGSSGSEEDTGLTSDACSMACDPSRRGIIDDWRNGIRNAT